MPVEATQRIAEYASDLTYRDLPEPAVDNAKLAILDTLGVTIAGSRHAATDILHDYVRTDSGDSPQATVVGRDHALRAEAAAFVNAGQAHVLDFDERGHASAHVLPAVLAVAEDLNSSGQALILSYLVGREVRMRLNDEIDAGRFDLSGRGPGSRGWHATGTLGSLGSGIAVGKLMDLDPRRLRTVVGIAGSLASGIMANFGTMTKCLHAGNAARNGVLSANLAARGFTADAAVLTSRRGFSDAMSLGDGGYVDRAAEALRSGFHIVDTGIRAKAYPSCTMTHQYIGAMLALKEKYGICADQVELIQCTASPALNRSRPHDDLEAKFSAPFALVATLLDGTVNLQNCSRDYLRRADVRRLLRQTVELPQEAEGWVRVRTRDGGDFRHPLVPPLNLSTWSDITEKFYACVVPVLGTGRAERIEKAVRSLADIESVRQLTRYL